MSTPSGLLNKEVNQTGSFVPEKKSARRSKKLRPDLVNESGDYELMRCTTHDGK